MRAPNKIMRTHCQCALQPTGIPNTTRKYAASRPVPAHVSTVPLPAAAATCCRGFTPRHAGAAAASPPLLDANAQAGQALGSGPLPRSLPTCVTRVSPAAQVTPFERRVERKLAEEESVVRSLASGVAAG